MMIYVITMMTTTNTGSSSRNPGLQGAWGETRTTQVRLKHLNSTHIISYAIRSIIGQPDNTDLCAQVDPLPPL